MRMLFLPVPGRPGPLEQNHWPAFLIDMLPQGFGREELIRRIKLSPTAAEEADWRLLLTGAGNPIGNLRVKEAAQWLKGNAGVSRGFTDAEVAQCGEDFAEYLASHGLFVAGSSGVQGEWLKVLLTRADDGLLYLDHTLADERAREHFIVKFGRGTNVELATILRHEAPYMALAERLGLRVHAPLVMKERALFIRRFDRHVGAQGVTRFAQESIATLTGMPGFGAVPSHDRVCSELIACCTNPLAEVLEYIKRDVANIALGNMDNHARNTAAAARLLRRRASDTSLRLRAHVSPSGRHRPAHPMGRQRRGSPGLGQGSRSGLRTGAGVRAGPRPSPQQQVRAGAPT